MVFVEDIATPMRNFCKIKGKYGNGNRFIHFSNQKSNPMRLKILAVY